MNTRWLHIAATAVCVAVFATLGCQPTPPAVDTDQRTTQDQRSDATDVEIGVDPGTGLSVDVEGEKSGRVDVNVNESGVDVDVNEPDQRDE